MFSNTATTHLMKTKESPLTNTNKFDLLHDNDFVEEVFYCPVSGAPNVYLTNHFTLNSQCLEVNASQGNTSKTPKKTYCSHIIVKQIEQYTCVIDHT